MSDLADERAETDKPARKNPLTARIDDELVSIPEQSACRCLEKETLVSPASLLHLDHESLTPAKLLDDGTG